MRKIEGRSPNDFLLTDPDLLQSLPGAMMRFRQHAVTVSTDIAEMFIQIGVRSEDRDALRYLWRENPSREPIEYRMRSIVFGATSSPATTICVKNRLQYPDAADLKLHTYVDTSKYAHDAALYWRVETPDGEMRTSLAKARVAPMKPTSILRLELQADVMGSRMAAAVTEEHYRKPDTSVLD